LRLKLLGPARELKYEQHGGPVFASGNDEGFSHEDVPVYHQAELSKWNTLVLALCL